ncbi:hypothetical protein MPTK1_2g17710 [Marchantia polymorpha subsp. ruderalis]|uniref:Uncharacterized protein n=1 Tax=Marchantia polymorpha TaxID=3197 RepID=A0A2R6WG79_MARPO|nr:hypothetical protein MARPO_0094s0039 [Marchantia polymorpha]BBN02739.1 hypothetical protein Mp_2g17710 [Marchantia polymorpha subsp. ruderalis]|eukprot:PTQ32865.1 hypothetical protein MARPO_0094s0039 [Marchantia polymorpha]
MDHHLHFSETTSNLGASPTVRHPDPKSARAHSVTLQINFTDLDADPTGSLEKLNWLVCATGARLVSMEELHVI